MIDPSFADITDEELSRPNGFVVPYPPTMQELEERLNNLQIIHDKNLESLEFTRERIQKFSAQIDAFEEALKFNGWDFDAETLNDLASYFDITLQREYMVEITVRFSGNVTVPMDYDIDDLENELNAEISKGYYSNSSVEIDFMEEEMDISYEEV